MARFRATIQGQRGSASRLGSTKSGITAQVNGWDVGVDVDADDENGTDTFKVYVTGGSRNAVNARHVGTVLLDRNGKPTFITVAS